MRATPVWGRRIAIAVTLAFIASTAHFPPPAMTAAAQRSAVVDRILIDQPDPPTVDVTPPALPPGTPSKQIPSALKGALAARPNHVSKLGAVDLQSLQKQGFGIVENQEGRVVVQQVVLGKAQQFVITDAKLRSGKEVIGFGFVDPAPQPSAGWFGITAEAVTWHFALCSYAWMNGYWDDLHVHLCAIDAAYTLALLGVLAAAAGAVIGLIAGIGCAELCAGIIGIAVATALAIEFIGFFWLHSDSAGNVDFVIPNYTMLRPFGGYVLWANSGRWDYMWNQCWILEDQWYDRYC